MKTVEFKNGKIILIDQTKLPFEEVFVEYDDYRDVVAAIRTMQVRGAPAIGVTSAFGIVLAALHAPEEKSAFYAEVNNACDVLAATRPTAVNLFWAINRMRSVVSEMQGEAVEDTRKRLLKEAITISDEDEAMCRAMGKHGNELIKNGDTILTH